MELARRAVADACMTFFWAFSIASLPAMAKFLALSLDVDALYVMVTLVSLHIISFGILSELIGGASFNPTVSLATALTTRTSLATLAVAIPAQMVGAVGGIRAICAAMPPQWQYTLQGPALKVPLLAGMVVEGVLTFAITLVGLWAMLRNSAARTAVVIVATLALVAAGGSLTGPMMNPANAFGWAFVERWHTTWEHFAVYWAGPTFGTLLAVWVFLRLFGAPHDSVKDKVKAL